MARVKASEEIVTVCYGQEEKWEKREDALAFYLECMAGSEGSEQSRYTHIYMQLMMGSNYCTDEDY